MRRILIIMLIMCSFSEGRMGSSYTAEGVQQFLANVQPFVGACELDDGMAVEIALEELLYEVVESDIGRKESDTFDVRNLRGAILTRLCKNINHKYVNGINCIYLNYSRGSEHSGVC